MFHARRQTWSSLWRCCRWRLAWCCCGWEPSSAQGPESAPWRSRAAPPPPTGSCAPIPSVSPPGSPVWHTQTHNKHTVTLPVKHHVWIRAVSLEDAHQIEHRWKQIPDTIKKPQNNSPSNGRLFMDRNITEWTGSLAKHHFLQLSTCLTKPDGGTSVRVTEESLPTSVQHPWIDQKQMRYGKD